MARRFNMSDDNNSSTRKLLQEKFGYTSNLPNHNNRLHDDVTDRNGQGGANPAYLPHFSGSRQALPIPRQPCLKYLLRFPFYPAA